MKMVVSRHTDRFFFVETDLVIKKIPESFSQNCFQKKIIEKKIYINFSYKFH